MKFSLKKYIDYTDAYSVGDIPRNLFVLFISNLFIYFFLIR